jgi:hypothetical protein
MKKYIAVAVALVVVLGAFLARDKFASVFPAFASLPHATTTPSTLPSFTVPVLTFGNIGAAPVGIEAWDTFQRYLAAAKAHDLAKLAALSYQLSPECKVAQADPSKMAPCTELMDSVAFFTESFKQSDFTRVAYDDKQIVIATDYLKIPDSDQPIKTVIYFIRDPSPKLLGIRFCIGKEGETDECVRTAPEKRDQNQNGWWDDVEALFKK